MKINKYWEKPTKRTYKRKSKFNRTYKKGKTKRIKETELTLRNLIITGTIAMYTFCGIYHFATSTRTVFIQGGANVVEARTEIIEQAVSDEIDYSGIPYIEKDKGTTEKQIRAIAKEQNFKWEDYLVNLACCEGLLKTDTINDKGNHPSCSIDRGLYGINNYWHAEVSDECAKDLECSTLWTINHINNGMQHEFICDRKIKGRKNYYKRCL